MDANKDLKGGIAVHGVSINNLRFADDIDLTQASSSSLQEVAQLLNEQGKWPGLVINKSKTQTMVFWNDNIDQPLKIDDYTLENVIRFTYLGSVFTYDNDCSRDLWTRIRKVRTSPTTQKRILETTAFTTVPYGCKTWTFNNKTRHKLLAFEMYCYQRILRISWTEWKKLWNMWKTQNWKGSGRANQRILRLFGHICRMEDNGKLKTLMFGIVDGTNKRGRPCREWMDDIVSWCKAGLQELNSLAQPQDRRWWKLITRQAMDTDVCLSHCSWRRYIAQSRAACLRLL